MLGYTLNESSFYELSNEVSQEYLNGVDIFRYGKSTFQVHLQYIIEKLLK